MIDTGQGTKVEFISMGGVFELIKQEKPREAAVMANRIVQRFPEECAAWHALGIAHQMLEQSEEAERCYRRALKIKTDLAETCYNLGHSLCMQDRFEESMQYYKKALRLIEDPEIDYNPAVGITGICINIAFAMHSLHRDEESAEWYLKAYEASPDDIDCKHNYYVTRMLLGDFSNKMNSDDTGSEFRPCKLFVDAPPWEGESIKGKHLLVWTNEGFGDTIQFIRFTKQLKEMGATVTVACYIDTVRILSTVPGVDKALYLHGNGRLDNNPPDYQVSLMNLPAVLGITPDTIPADVPYVTPDPGMTEFWREKLHSPDYKIGVVWQGRADHPTLKNRRSYPLSLLEPLSRLPGVHLYSLQRDAGTDQLDDATFPITNIGKEIHDFMDAATVMQNMDLIISPDTAAAHVGGALGKPTWVLLPYVCDWRWPYGRSNSPWYPTVRLFRQEVRHDWPGVIREVEKSLKEILKDRPLQDESYVRDVR